MYGRQTKPNSNPMFLKWEVLPMYKYWIDKSCNQNQMNSNISETAIHAKFHCMKHETEHVCCDSHNKSTTVNSLYTMVRYTSDLLIPRFRWWIPISIFLLKKKNTNWDPPSELKEIPTYLMFIIPRFCYSRFWPWYGSHRPWYKGSALYYNLYTT